LLRRALGGPGREEEGELFGDRLAQRLAQVRIDDDFAEMERVILLLLVGGEAVGSLWPGHGGQTPVWFFQAREFKICLAHARFTRRRVVGHGFNRVAARLQVSLAVEKYLAISGSLNFVSGAAQLVMLAHLLDHPPGFVSDERDYGEIGVVDFLFIIGRVSESGGWRFNEDRRKSQPFRFGKTQCADAKRK